MFVPTQHWSGFRAIIFAIAVLLCSQSALAQLPRRVKRCLPYPTFADEIVEARVEAEAKLPPPRRIIIDTIRFQSPSPLPQRLRELLTGSIKAAPTKATPGWLDELSGVIILDALEDRGYFRADAHSTAKMLSEDADTQHVALSISVDTGLQYRVGDVGFRSARADVPLAFSEKRLRKCVLIRRGEVFDVSKLRRSFWLLKNLYGAAGWIDFTPTPQFKINDRTKRIDLLLQLDQERQYRVKGIQFLGNDPAAEVLIRAKLKIGEPFDGLFFERFYATHKSILPADASPEDVTLDRNSKTGVVNIHVDFRTCPDNSGK
jgi:hypothetical protein